MPDIGLITCRRPPEPDPDEGLLSEALTDLGISSRLVAWDDPTSRPTDYRLCVFRSCWNYFEDIDAFLRWLGHTERAVALVNDADTVRWNVHKRYLRSLEAEGVPTVPTVFGWRGQKMDLAALADTHGWTDVVVKPAISAGSVRTRRFRKGHIPSGQRFLDTLLDGWDVMIQPYLQSVESPSGERSVLGIDGAWTHTIRKSPRFEGDGESISEAFPVSDDEAAIADRCLEAIPYAVLYARVDLMRDDEGQWCVSELELIEPSLFLKQSPEALKRYVEGIVRIVRSG